MYRQYGLYDVPPSPSRVIFPSEVRQDSGVPFESIPIQLPSVNGSNRKSLLHNGYNEQEYFPSSSQGLQERVASAAPQAQFNSPAHNFTQHLRERSPSSSSALLNLLQRYPSARRSVDNGRIFQAEERAVDRQLFRPADASTGYPLVEVAVPKQTPGEIQRSFPGLPDQRFSTYSNGYTINSDRENRFNPSSQVPLNHSEEYGQVDPGHSFNFCLNNSSPRYQQYPHSNYNQPGLGSKHLLQRNNWPEELDIDSLFAEDEMNRSTAEWKSSFAQIQDRFRPKATDADNATMLHGFSNQEGQARGMLTKSSSHNEIHDRSILGHAVVRAQEAPEFRRSGALDTFWSSTVRNRLSSPIIPRISSNLTAAERLQLLQEPVDFPSNFSAPAVPQRTGSKTALAVRREQYLHEANSPPLTPRERAPSQPLANRPIPNFSELDNAVQELQSGIRQTSYSQGARRLGGCGRFPTDEHNLSPPRIGSRKYTPSPTDTVSESSSVYQVPNGLPHPKPKHNIKEQIYQAGIQSNFFPRMGLRTNTNFPVPTTGSVASRITEFERRPGTPTLHIANNYKSFDSGPMSPRSTVFRAKPVIHVDIGSSHHRPSQQATTVFSFEVPTSPRTDSLEGLNDKLDALALHTPTKVTTLPETSAPRQREQPRLVFDVSATASDTSNSSNDSSGVLHGLSFTRTIRGIQDEQELIASPVVQKKGRVYPPPQKFYFPQGNPVPQADNDAALRRGCEVFRTLPEQKCLYEDMDKLCKAVGLPIYWKKPVYKCMMPFSDERAISVTDFTAFWRAMTSVAHDEAARFVYILTQGNKTEVTREMFRPLILDVIHTHPGLAFYRSSTEFHDKYCDVVVTRIFWNHVKAWTQSLTVQDIRRGDLLEKIRDLEDEEDINRNLRYFSYEHFYVVYCLFWEIDTDHDLKIKREDLQRHMKGAIPKIVVERVFTRAVCKQRCSKITEIGLVEFTQFLLADEDKFHPSSIEYWFRIIDEDGDGIITLYDMESYYKGIQEKLTEESIDCMKFSDVACHLIDAVQPKQEHFFRRADLKNNKLAPRFFNSFVNWRKFFVQETTEGSEPSVKDENGQELTDWDRFCAEEYEALMDNQSEGDNVDCYDVYLDDDEDNRSASISYNQLL